MFFFQFGFAYLQIFMKPGVELFGGGVAEVFFFHFLFDFFFKRYPSIVCLFDFLCRINRNVIIPRRKPMSEHNRRNNSLIRSQNIATS